MNTSNTGRFVWYELMTTEPTAAMAFYGDVVGWKTQPFGDGSGYTMWVGGQGPLGGVLDLPEPARKMGAPPHWMASVTVANVDAAVAKVRELGGQIYVEPQDVPTVGRFSVVADPQGASISLFTPSGEMADHDQMKAGEFCWRELLTTDQAGAFSFYSALFGWEKTSEFDMGSMGVYLLYGRAGKTLGGIMTKPKEMQMPSSWLYYVEVSDLEAAIARATGKGGKLLNGPHTVPTGGRIAQLMDPQGAAFALHENPKTAA